MYITKNINNFKSYNNKKIFIKHFHKKEFDDTNFKFSLPLRSKICVNNNNIIHTFNQYGTINKLVIFENIYTLYIGINIKLKSNIKLNNIVNTYHNNCVSYSYYDNNNILKKEGFIITFYQPRQYDYKIKNSKDGDYILIEEDNEYIEYEKETGLYIYNFNDNFYQDYTFSNNYSNYDYSELNYNSLPNNDFNYNDFFYNYKQNQNKILENFNYDNQFISNINNYKLDSKTKNIELKYDNEKENNILDNENIQSNNEIENNLLYNENNQINNENDLLDNVNNKINDEKIRLDNENNQINNENNLLDNKNNQFDSNEFSYTPINYIHSLNKENMYEIIKIFYNNFQLKNKLINNIKLYLIIIMVIIFLIIKII